MDDYATKPIRKGTLRDALEHWVPWKAGAASTREAETPSAPTIVASLDPELRANLRSWREDAGDEVVDELVITFLQSTRDRVASLRAALDAKDFAQAEFLTHGLKGSSATFGAMNLARVSEVLEAAVKSRTDGELSPLVRKLEESFQVIEDAISSGGTSAR